VQARGTRQHLGSCRETHTARKFQFSDLRVKSRPQKVQTPRESKSASARHPPPPWLLSGDTHRKKISVFRFESKELARGSSSSEKIQESNPRPATPVQLPTSGLTATSNFRLACDPPAIKGKVLLSGIETYASALKLARRGIQGTPLDGSRIMAGGDPAAQHPSAPALVRGQLHGRLARCQSRECRSRV